MKMVRFQGARENKGNGQISRFGYVARSRTGEAFGHFVAALDRGTAGYGVTCG
jgi:hypothetical protein